MKVGTTELILILVVALVIFGPSKLPELGKLAGQAVGSFKKYLNTFEEEWKEEPQTQEKRPAAAAAAESVSEKAPAAVSSTMAVSTAPAVLSTPSETAQETSADTAESATPEQYI